MEDKLQTESKVFGTYWKVWGKCNFNFHKLCFWLALNTGQIVIQLPRHLLLTCSERFITLRSTCNAWFRHKGNTRQQHCKVVTLDFHWVRTSVSVASVLLDFDSSRRRVHNDILLSRRSAKNWFSRSRMENVFRMYVLERWVLRPKIIPQPSITLAFYIPL